MFNLPISKKPSKVDGTSSELINLLIKRYRRVIATVFLIIAIIYPGELGEITRLSIFDAYTQVTVFVAVTLLIFFSLEHFFKIDVGALMERGGVWPHEL